ncbi:hypothetical protein Bca101_006016 [Brassica carinata]
MAPLRRRRSCLFDDGPRSEIREGDLANMRMKYAILLSVGMRDPTEFERAPDGGAIEEPSRGVRGNYPFRDGWSNRYVFVKMQEPVGYPTSWRTVDGSHPVSCAGEAVAKLIMGVPRRFRWVTFLVRKEALRHSRVWGNVVKLPISAIYDEHQKVKTKKRRPLYTPPPRLARAASLVNGSSSTSS